MKNKNPKYPVREYLGKFESWLITMGRSSAMYHYDRVLERLFNMFPAKVCCSQFTSIDIADYKSIRLAKGISELSLYYELGMLKGFWRWLLEDQGLPVNNPVRAFIRQTKGSKRYAKGISLVEVNRVLAICSVKEKRAILAVMQGNRVPGFKLSRNIRERAEGIGIPDFRLGRLKLLITNRLARDIVQSYCKQLSDSLPKEAQSNSNSLGTVQAPAFDKGSTVSNYRNNLSSVSGVHQQEPGPKRESTVSHS